MNRNLVLRFVLLYTMPAEAFRQPPPTSRARSPPACSPPLPTTVFPLEETAAAHDAVEDGALGKVVIAVTASPRSIVGWWQRRTCWRSPGAR